MNDFRDREAELTRALNSVGAGLAGAISLLEAGCSVPEVAAITGQSYQMVQHYAAGISQRRLGKAAILKLENNRTKRDKSA